MVAKCADSMDWVAVKIFWYRSNEPGSPTNIVSLLIYNVVIPLHKGKQYSHAMFVSLLCFMTLFALLEHNYIST